MVTSRDVLAALRTVSLTKVEMAGVEFYVRGVTGAERKLLVDRAKDGNPLQSYELVAMCACNEKGDALFTLDQAEELAAVDGDALERIGLHILTASKLLPEQQEQAEKN